MAKTFLVQDKAFLADIRSSNGKVHLFVFLSEFR